MSTTLFGLGLSQQFDENGDPMSGAKLYLYEANTSTPVISYSDFALTSVQPWPFVADSTGRIPAFWLEDGNYRARLTDADDVVVFDEADITAVGPPVSAISTWTPVLTFVTPGTLTIGAYTTQSAQFIKIGSFVFYSFAIIATGVVKGSASGSLLVSGLPFTSSSFPFQFLGACSYEGITLPAGRTQIQTMLDTNSDNVIFSTSGSAAGVNVIDAANVNNGTVALLGAGCFQDGRMTMLTAVFEPISNREDWIDQCEVRNQANALVDLSTATIVIAVRDQSCMRQVLTASTDDGGVTIEGTGVFEFTFPLASMRGLAVAQTYDVGCTIAINGTTRQFFIGSVPVLDGIVA